MPELTNLINLPEKLTNNMLVELIIEAKRECVEDIYNALFLSNISAYSVIDEQDLVDVISNQKNWDYFDYIPREFIDEKIYIKIVLENMTVESKMLEIKKYLKDFEVDINKVNFKIEKHNAIDWLNEWKKFYDITTVGKYMIVPYWKDSEFNEPLKILIEPSTAFGTGEHESTKIALQLMSIYEFENKKVLDVGTGSGILGIAASKSGASKVVMVDIDDNSIINARANSVLNAVKSKVNIFKSVFLSEVNQEFDIIISNMTADLNIKLLMEIEKIRIKNQHVLLSGILSNRVEEVKKICNNLNYKIIEENILGEWIGFLAKHIEPSN